jgi:phosphopantetheinyl transferase
VRAVIDKAPVARRDLENELGDYVSRALGVRLALSIATDPLDGEALTPAEARRLATLHTEARRDSWRRGRAALKRVLGKLGQPHETAGLAFPHPRLSLTHSGSLAVAVGGPAALDGIGVDLERDRPVRPEAARFFLTDDEQAWARALSPGEQRRQLLRLWTVKEALFKADPENQDAGLYEYRVDSPALHRGEGSRRGRAGRFSYVTCRFQTATLTVATLQ